MLRLLRPLDCREFYIANAFIRCLWGDTLLKENEERKLTPSIDLHQSFHNRLGNRHQEIQAKGNKDSRQRRQKTQEA